MPSPSPAPRRPRRQPAARVPVAAALRSLVEMAAGPLSLVAGAAGDARTAAMKGQPEPVLGAP